MLSSVNTTAMIVPGAPLREAPALLENIRLGWKGFLGTITPAYLASVNNPIIY